MLRAFFSQPFCRFIALLAAALSVGGCEGSVLGGESGRSAMPPGGSAGVDAVGPNPAGSCAEATPGPMYLRRLTNQEYGASVRDLLGAEAELAMLPPDLTLYGFDNNAESVALSTAHLEAYRALAEKLAGDLVASAPRRSQLVTCDLAGPDGAACLASFVRGFGLKAWRRPLSDAEVSELTTRASAAPPTTDSWSSVRYVLEALLQSPSFLFRVERGEPDAARPGVAALTGYELATRLSYLLWGTTPDAELLEAAGTDELASADGVEKRALAMLDDSGRALPAAWSFARQWLRLGNLAGVTRPEAEYPLFSEAMRLAMADEARRLVERHTSQPGVPLLDLLDTTSTFVNATLAPLYGVAAPAGEGWEQITLPLEQGRRGLLTLPGVLTLTGSTHATTPILRGKYVRQVLLCDELPPPPPEVPSLSAATAGSSERERLGLHRANPACAGCHELLEPLGFGLSHFDAIGQYRSRDAAGAPIDASGVIAGLDDAQFEGAAQLATRLRGAPKVAQCLSTHLVRFALGRKETASDVCIIGQLGSVLEQGGDYRALVRALVRSDAFRYRPGGVP